MTVKMPPELRFSLTLTLVIPTEPRGAVNRKPDPLGTIRFPATISANIAPSASLALAATDSCA